MFRVDELRLFGNDRLANSYSFGESNYFHANNNMGKTLLVTALDYMLGSSSVGNFFEREGMDGIDRIEMDVETNNGLYIFARTSNALYYKLSNEGVFQKVDLAMYKSKIDESLVSVSNQELVNYKIVYGDNLSFRAFSFLNFIDEIGLGDIANVFTRQHQAKHAFRIERIFDFLFNYDAIKKKVEIEQIIDQQTKRLNVLIDESNHYYNALNELKRILEKYNIEYIDDLNHFKKAIANIRLSSNEGKKTFQNGRLYELLGKIHSLSIEIKKQRLLQEHSLGVLERSKKTINLLKEFNEILSGTSLAEQYYQEIEHIFEEEKFAQSILLSKDYSKTIISLEERKASLERELESISHGCELPTLEERLADAELSLGFYKIVEQGRANSDQIADLKESIAQLNESLKNISKKEQSISETINKSISDLYLHESKVKFVSEDMNVPGFEIVFNHKSLNLCGKKIVNANPKYYLPGSLAKMTSWQVCAYLAIMKYIIENRNLPVLPILSIDGLNQPFDKTMEGYPELLRMIIQSAKACNIQVIITSTEYGEELEQILFSLKTNVIDLNDGFNSFYKPLDTNK